MFTRRMMLKIAAVALLHPALRWTAPDPPAEQYLDPSSAPSWFWHWERDREDWGQHWDEIRKMTIPELRAAGPASLADSVSGLLS